jgi:hypothetical protein
MQLKRIFKFDVLKGSDFKINMPKDAKILYVQTQFGEPKLWAIVDDENKIETRTFKVIRTGHILPEESGEYIGTFQTLEGLYMWHLFEITNNKSETVENKLKK